MFGKVTRKMDLLKIVRPALSLEGTINSNIIYRIRSRTIFQKQKIGLYKIYELRS